MSILGTLHSDTSKGFEVRTLRLMRLVLGESWALTLSCTIILDHPNSSSSCPVPCLQGKHQEIKLRWPCCWSTRNAHNPSTREAKVGGWIESQPGEHGKTLSQNPLSLQKPRYPQGDTGSAYPTYRGTSAGTVGRGTKWALLLLPRKVTGDNRLAI